MIDYDALLEEIDEVNSRVEHLEYRRIRLIAQYLGVENATTMAEAIAEFHRRRYAETDE